MLAKMKIETSITVSTSVQPISITKTLLIVPTKNERDHICPTYFHNQNITDCSDQTLYTENVISIFPF